MVDADDIATERRFRDALKVLTSLEGAGFQARLAGGCVRDRLRGVAPKDFDVATTAKPAEVQRHFAAIGWRTVPTGIEHGTVTLVLPSGPVEITTLRLDVATDGRHAEVRFGSSFEEDAARRDFTINAMFEDARGVVFDYHGGKQDLEARRLRFVGDAAARIREDYLRILRLFRFWARFGYAPEAATLAAVTKESGGLARLSQERVTSELMQTFAGEHAEAAVRGMAAAAIWDVVLPEAKGGGARSEAGFWAALRSAPTTRRALATLAATVLATRRVDAVALERLGVRLKLSSADTRSVGFVPEALRLAAEPPSDVATSMDVVDRMEQHGGDGALPDLYAVVARALSAAGVVPANEWTSIQALLRSEERDGARRRLRLPIDGHAVMKALGVSAGAELGALLDAAKRAFRNGEFETADDALAWLSARRPANAKSGR